MYCLHDAYSEEEVLLEKHLVYKTRLKLDTLRLAVALAR